MLDFGNQIHLLKMDRENNTTFIGLVHCDVIEDHTDSLSLARLIRAKITNIDYMDISNFQKDFLDKFPYHNLKPMGDIIPNLNEYIGHEIIFTLTERGLVGGVNCQIVKGTLSSFTASQNINMFPVLKPKAK